MEDKTSRNEKYIWNEHLLDKIKNRWETAEAKISELEDIPIESVEAEAHRKEWRLKMALC